MKKSLLIILGILVILGGVWFLFGTKSAEAPVGDGSPDPEFNTYRADMFAFGFQFPNRYFLDEQNVGNGEREHYVVSLTEDTEEHRLVRSGKAPVPQEGPVTISVDLYQNNLDSYSAESWIRGTSDSNFKLSPDGKLEKITLGGKEALSYRWSGLYEGKTIVVAGPRWIYAFSVTWMSPEDQIVKDWNQMLTTVEFSF